jgi:DNA-binding XRE family transcriptional regulator
MMAHKLLEVRKAVGLTQQQMARQLMLSTSIYALYEQGRRQISEAPRLQQQMVQSLRKHQEYCEQLKLSVASIKCTKNCTNEAL